MQFGRLLRKKGISAVLASVIIIAVTLIAATAISGFIFGLFGTFTSSAIVSASGDSNCVGTPESCTLYLTNSGSSNVAITGACILKFGGSTYLGTATLVSGNLNAGNRATISCVSNTPSSHATSGTQITGQVTIGNGAQVLFAASAQ